MCYSIPIPDWSTPEKRDDWFNKELQDALYALAPPVEVAIARQRAMLRQGKTGAATQTRAGDGMNETITLLNRAIKALDMVAAEWAIAVSGLRPNNDE